MFMLYAAGSKETPGRPRDRLFLHGGAAFITKWVYTPTLAPVAHDRKWRCFDNNREAYDNRASDASRVGMPSHAPGITIPQEPFPVSRPASLNGKFCAWERNGGRQFGSNCS